MAQTILLIDDSADLRAMVTTYLTQDGFRVVAAARSSPPAGLSSVALEPAAEQLTT